MNSPLSFPESRPVAPPCFVRGNRAVRFLGVSMILWMCQTTAPAANLSLQTLYEFGLNPKNPQAGLAQATDGNFYGTTELGGTNGENGTIFRMTPSGVSLMFSFSGTDGSRPLAGLIQASDGNLYGTT